MRRLGTSTHSTACLGRLRRFCTATCKLCLELDPGFQWEGNSPGSPLTQTITALNAELHPADHVVPEPEKPPRQQYLSMRLDMMQHEAYLETLSIDDRATLLSEMLPGASGFLEAIPSKHLDLAWDPCEFLVELRTRLLVNVYDVEEWCTVCNAVSDCKGHQARKCAGVVAASDATMTLAI